MRIEQRVVDVPARAHRRESRTQPAPAKVVERVPGVPSLPAVPRTGPRDDEWALAPEQSVTPDGGKVRAGSDRKRERAEDARVEIESGPATVRPLEELDLEDPFPAEAPQQLFHAFHELGRWR